MRKPNLLLHSAGVDGTSLVRVYPYRYIDSINIKEIRIDDNLTWEALYGIDVAMFQRPCVQVEMRTIDVCKSYNIPVILDYDDLTLDIDNETNPAAEFYKSDAVKATIIACIKAADIVTVSTQGLKDALLEYVPTADVRVVPNAIDDNKFSTEISYHERNKLIMLRGAASHYWDWLLYKNGILELLEKFPDYKLAAMGYHPTWLRELPANQIQYYEFKDIPGYYTQLMNLRPKISIVPLVDDKFNRCKSSIALHEAVIAGAACMSTKLPEFEKVRAATFTDNKSFVETASKLLTDENLWHSYYTSQLSLIPRLSDVNEQRLDIIEELVAKKKKYKPTIPVLKTATDKEFHDYALSRGHNEEDKSYRDSHAAAAQKLIDILRPRTAFEYGCGTGGTLVELLKRGVMAYGVEINPHSVEYFQERHPMYAQQITLLDFTQQTIAVDTKGDLGMSIEVFEHIDMPEDWWDNFIQGLAVRYKNFYFSSTPYHTTETFDFYWGHVNLRRTTDWIKLFEKNGWKFVNHPKILTNWDCLFECAEKNADNPNHDYTK